MLDLEFADEFSRRSESVVGSEKSQELLDEFESLDPREANIIYRVFNSTPGSVEFNHAKVRLSSLVASGFISSDLAKVATFADISEEQETPKLGTSDQASREFLLSSLDLFGIGYESNLLDPKGELEYRIVRGDSKEQILAYLENKIAFKSMQEVATNPQDDDEMVAAFKFNEFMNALNALEDSPKVADFKEIAKKHVAKYDANGLISQLIDSGAASSAIFDELDNNPVWTSDAEDFYTRDYVESPRPVQVASWDQFLSTINAIKDLDSI